MPDRRFPKDRINFLLEWLSEKGFFKDLRNGFIYVNNFTVDLNESFIENDMGDLMSIDEYNAVNQQILRLIERIAFEHFGGDILVADLFQTFKVNGVYTKAFLFEDLNLPPDTNITHMIYLVHYFCLNFLD